MEKNYYFWIICFLFSTNISQAQLASSNKFFEQNKISVDLVGGVLGRLPFTSEYGLIYNRRVASKIELSAKLAYSDLNLFMKGLSLDLGGRLRDSLGVNGIALGSAMQYFWNAPSQNSWFSGLELNYTFTHYQDKNRRDQYFNLSKFSTSVILGYRLYLSSLNLELDGFIGLGIAFRNYFWEKYEDENSTGSGTGSLANASWRVGWGLVLESSTKYAIPIGLRIGHRF